MKLGLTKGDRIGVWGGNHYEWLLAYAAALQLGLITVSKYNSIIAPQQQYISASNKIIDHPEIERGSFGYLDGSSTKVYNYVCSKITFDFSFDFLLHQQVHMRMDFPLNVQPKILEKVRSNTTSLNYDGNISEQLKRGRKK